MPSLEAMASLICLVLDQKLKPLNSTIQIQYFKSPLGELILGSFQDQLCLCDWRYRKMRAQIDNRIQKGLQAYFEESSSVIIEETKKQLSDYFKSKMQNFDLPILFVGSDFQKQVWQALLQIPFGKSESYLGLAKRLDNEKAIRAVATANGANAISIIVPCHRIIGSDGSLVGYAGGLSAKKKLLELEGAINQQQLELF
jgi:methylated-DNA-[protein]-cysteine S-methyltransferase